MSKIRVYLVCDWDNHLRPYENALLADDRNNTLSDYGTALEPTGTHLEVFKEESEVSGKHGRTRRRIFFHGPETGFGLITSGSYARKVSNERPYRQMENELPAPNTLRIIQDHLIPRDIVTAALFERSTDSVLADEVRSATMKRFEVQRTEIDAERNRAPYSQEARIEAEKRKRELDRQLDEELKQLRVPHILHYIRRILAA